MATEMEKICKIKSALFMWLVDKIKTLLTLHFVVVVAVFILRCIVIIIALPKGLAIKRIFFFSSCIFFTFYSHHSMRIVNFHVHPTACTLGKTFSIVCSESGDELVPFHFDWSSSSDKTVLRFKRQHTKYCVRYNCYKIYSNAMRSECAMKICVSNSEREKARHGKIGKQ